MFRVRLAGDRGVLEEEVGSPMNRSIPAAGASSASAAA